MGSKGDFVKPQDLNLKVYENKKKMLIKVVRYDSLLIKNSLFVLVVTNKIHLVSGQAPNKEAM